MHAFLWPSVFCVSSLASSSPRKRPPFARWVVLAAILTCTWLALTGCSNLATYREIVWAQMGTPGRIVDQRPVKVLVLDEKDGWIAGDAVLSGMVAIDEPTLDYLREQEERNRGPPE